MIPLFGDEIRRAVGGRWLRRPAELSVRGITTDSRSASEGDLFVALRGERFDGHDYLTQSAQGGCVMALVEISRTIPAATMDAFSGGVIGVDGTTASLGMLGAYHREKIAANVIAVTGSNGKTTVKRMIHHILSRRLKGSCSPKSYNNNIGVPLTLLDVGQGDDYVVCEVGTNAPGEIAQLGDICRPDLAVITSIGPSHLEKLVDTQGVAFEKASLLDCLKPGGAAVVPVGCEPLDKALRCRTCHLITFGQDESSNLRMSGYRPTDKGCEFIVNGKVKVALPMSGAHNASNALSAIASAMRFGTSLEEAAVALEDFAGERMRLTTIDAGAVTIIDDTYNANPLSMAAAAGVLAERQAQRRVMIAGDMLELGDEAKKWHRRTAGVIAQSKIDVLVGVGSLGGVMANEAKKLGLESHAFETVEAATEALPALIKDGDVVLLKGSRSMGMERLVDPIRRAFRPAGDEL